MYNSKSKLNKQKKEFKKDANLKDSLKHRVKPIVWLNKMLMKIKQLKMQI